MAIRFVDKVPEGKGPDGTKAARARPDPTPPAAETAADGEGDAGVEARLPGLTHAKPEPKPRGRKVPMAKPAADEVKPADGAGTDGTDGLLPGPQIHAKTTPKPRGRKKAFG